MATKPETVAAATVAVTASPLAGDYAIIVLAALLGAFVALSKIDPGQHKRRLDGAYLIFRSVAIALAFSYLAATFAARFLGQDVSLLLFPVAFLIGWVGDGWTGLRDKMLNRLSEKG